MRDNFNASLAHVLEHEGGYVNNPKDPGGETNKGVTKAVYEAYRRRKGHSRQSVRHITDVEIQDIYKAQYWDRVEGDRLPAGVDYAVFDYAVNSGTGRAETEIQRVVGVTADGQIGMVTLDAVGKADPIQLVNKLCDRRLAFMKRIKHRKTKELLWTTFGKGWSRRVAGVRKHGVEMASTAPAPDLPPPPDVPTPLNPKPAPVSLWARFMAWWNS